MRRPLCIATIAYIIGILIGLYLNLGIAFIVIVLILISFLLYSHVKKIKITKSIFFIVIIVLGVIYVKYTDMKYENFYKEIFDIKDAKIKGIIVSNAKEKEYKNIYEVKVLSINRQSKYKGIKLILNVKKKDKQPTLEYGDLVEIVGEFEIPSKERNYKGFNYKKYLKSKKIYATLDAKENVTIKSKKSNGVINQIIHKAQNKVKTNIYKILSEKTKDLAIGILIGDRENITEQVSYEFRQSNLTHMLAVSGAHISYIILGLSKLLNKTGKKFSKVSTIVFLLFFMGLTNYTPSVTRASIMAILILISKLVYRKADIYNNLALSTLIILLSNPYTILNLGFQLSYMGTIGIVLLETKITKYFYRKINWENNEKNIIKKVFRYIIDSIILTLSANILILPIMTYNFNTISLTFWISNLLASPLMGGIVILGFLTYFISLVSIFLANIIAFPLEIMLNMLLIVARICSKIPLSSIVVKTPYIFSIIIYYLMIYGIVNYKKIIEKNVMKFIYKFAIYVCIVVFICEYILNRNTKNLMIYFVDVGQGDCTLICTPYNKNILIDGGGSETGSFDVGKNTLLPYLLDRRIKILDYVLISHFDSDHVGGLLTILEQLKVKNVIISKQAEQSKNYIRFKEIVKKKKINVIIVKQNDRIQIEKKVYFHILFPEEKLINENALNNNSIVAKLCYNNFTMLFTGDIEKIAEEQLVEKYKDTNLLKSTVLKIAHHGSKGSSIQEILDSINPQIALIGVSEKNTFGHPNKGVINRLENINCKIYRTDKMGEVSLTVTSKRKNKST